MNDAARWIAGADTDMAAVRRCLAEPPNPAVATYHCQQAAEKLIKAVMVALSIPYSRGRAGHDLGRAATLIPLGHKLRQTAASFEAIADWSISFRCPADEPLQAEPLPEQGEVAAWLQGIDTFRAEVASLIASSPR